MTKYQILLTLYHYLAEEYEKDSSRSESFRDYISSVNPYLWTDGKTADPDYYADFMDIADKLFEGDYCPAEDGLKYAKLYLHELNRLEHDEYGGNIDEVEAVFANCTQEKWDEITGRLREKKTKKRKCACCEYYTLEDVQGGFEICPVCFWEDDASQNSDPEFTGGANKVCLREAQENFEKFGACTESAVPFVREPSAEEVSGIIRGEDSEEELY